MKIPIALLFLMVAVTVAQGQAVNGSNNGNGNVGYGNGNGNGTGNGNGSNNSTTASASGGTVNLNGRRNTPAVNAPSLAAAGIESCLGSTSIGGSGPGFGVTIAGTMTDRGCNLRLFSRTLYNLGYKAAATQILCNDPDVAAALAVEGVRCQVGAAAQSVSGVEASTEAVPGAPAVCDNYVLFRGCLDKPKPVNAQGGRLFAR